MISTVLIFNMPAPYREKIHELISDHFNRDFKVIYCAEKEANREWKFTEGNYEKVSLKKVNAGPIHNNISIFKHLQKLDPQTVIITGFFPTMLYAWIWSLLRGRNLIVYTDGTFKLEERLSIIHKFIRKLVFIKAKAYIGPAIGSQLLYESYGIAKYRFFRTYLCVDNSLFYLTKYEDKEYDLMFSGQFIKGKLPFFFIDVVNEIKRKTGRCKVLILGSGHLKEEILNKLDTLNVDYYYPGFIPQKDLPKFYTKSKLLLFPTTRDAWGIVANEAMASGVPVITCSNAGCAGDLVIHGENGFVLPLDKEVWADKIIETLQNKDEYIRLSKNAITHVQKYNFENAANGIIDAINYCKR